MGIQLLIPLEKLTLFYESLVRFYELLETRTLSLKLNPGTVLFIDNWRILHGRTEFTGQRSLATGYFPRSDWQSRARVLGAL
jgi:trimethyllysine dioxygenase